MFVRTLWLSQTADQFELSLSRYSLIPHGRKNFDSRTVDQILCTPLHTIHFIQNRSMGSKQLDFKKSFQICIQPILTAVSKEDIHGAFQMYSNAEKENLYRLFIQVSKALHGNIVEQFESKCQESQVLTTFDKIDHLVEEQTLDMLLADVSNIKDIKERISTLKMNEIQYLQSLLQKVEEQNSSMENQILSLKKNQVQTNALNAAEKLKSWSSLL